MKIDSRAIHIDSEGRHVSASDLVFISESHQNLSSEIFPFGEKV